MSKLKPTDIVRTNSGYMKVNNIELAELKELKVSIKPNTKKLPLMNHASDGEVTMSYECKITFKLNKRYSRFKPAILAAAKKLQDFKFDFESTSYTPDGNEEESLFISDCWINGEVVLAELNSETDFAEETFEAGFMIENSDYTSIIDDGEDW